jgi:glycine betaine/proline transport system permease protein
MTNDRRNPTSADRLWLGLLVLSVMLTIAGRWFPWLSGFPTGWTLPVSQWANAAFLPIFEFARPFGRSTTPVIEAVLGAIRAGLVWIPWPAAVLAICLVALRACGWRVMVLAALSLLAVVGIGYWAQAMNTLALVLVSVPTSVVLGFGVGALAHRLPRLRPLIEALLDVMQTYPAFAYLIPLLLLFGFGPAAGLLASVVFAVPPMVRNTIVGLGAVPAEIIESAAMAGARPGQLFWQARVPVALPQLLIGLNQTTMAALSMVIIVAIIGGFDDIGWEILSAMRKAEMGRSLASGLVIVLLAVLLDRMTSGIARQSRLRRAPPIAGRNLVIGLLLAALLATGLKLAGWTLLPGDGARSLFRHLDLWLLDFVAWSAPAFALLRNAITYGLMLPMRLGFSGSASPMVWGLTLTPAVTAGYVAVALGLVVLAARRSPRAAVATGFAALLFWSGLPGFPWTATLAIVGAAAWRSGGPWLLGLAASGLLIAGVSGLWVPMMQSIYLCAVAVVICFALGGALGIAAAQSDRLSAVLRPINDALQTMPQFVFLIPALMLFKVGEFTALIAIVLYAIVPPIRYVEHGLRTVRPDVVEASRQMGATPWQMLWQVKLPLASDAVRLALNQTVMAAVSMLVIAALVGTRELGQEVYVALSKADAGRGLVAGWIIACIALVADRVLRRRRAPPSHATLPEKT